MAVSFKPNDLVLYEKGDNIMANNFKLNKNISKRFKNLSVPPGLLLINDPIYPNLKFTNNDEIVKDSLYDNLIDLANNFDKKKKYTKKRSNKPKNKTKKH